MSDTNELPQPEVSGSSSGDVGAASAEQGTAHDAARPPVQQPSKGKAKSDELVKPTVKAPEPTAVPTLSIDKTQGVHFVRTYVSGVYSEFVLEDVVAILQQGAEVCVMLRDGHVISFESTKKNADSLLDAWRSRRAARRNA